MHHVPRKPNNDKQSWSWGFFGVLIPTVLSTKLCEQRFLRTWENYRKWTKEAIGKGGVDSRKCELMPKDLLVIAHVVYEQLRTNGKGCPVDLMLVMKG
jgi:hypothetical protein